MTSIEWELRIHDAVVDQIEDMDSPVREAVRKALLRLKTSPSQRSKSLSGSLKGARTFRFGTPAGEYRALVRLRRKK